LHDAPPHGPLTTAGTVTPSPQKAQPDLYWASSLLCLFLSAFYQAKRAPYGAPIFAASAANQQQTRPSSPSRTWMKARAQLGTK
jgi:hypothetical protein